METGSGPRRVFIIGGAGTGRTALARQVAARLGAPAYDLVEVGYEGGAGRRRSLDERLGDVHRIAVRPAWVAEGGFLWWTDEFLVAAVMVVWLDLPWRVAARRIALRHVKADLAAYDANAQRFACRVPQPPLPTQARINPPPSLRDKESNGSHSYPPRRVSFLLAGSDRVASNVSASENRQSARPFMVSGFRPLLSDLHGGIV